MIVSLVTYACTTSASLDVMLTKTAAVVNRALKTNAKIRAKKIPVDQMQCVLFQTKELVALAHLEWFQAQQLKLVVSDHRLFHVLKTVIVLKVLLVSMNSVDQYAQMMQVV